MNSVIYKLLFTGVSAFVLAVIIAPMWLPFLRKHRIFQKIKMDGPNWHLSKNNTPTVGGIVFIVPFVVCTLLFSNNSASLWIMLFGLAFGAIGLLDDFLKVKRKTNDGLSSKQKFLLQIAVSILFLYLTLNNGILTSEIALPFIYKTVDIGLWYIPLAIIVMVGTTNAVNLTDGVDGLSSSVTIVVSIVLAIISYMSGNMAVTVSSAVLCGGCLGFFMFNKHPAKMFMGDTGSIFLGGTVCAMALVIKQPLLLVIIGGVYVLEAVSVILQVLSNRIFHRRIFRMAPLHHHFEQGGWSENRIVLVAVLCSVVLGIIAVIGGFNLG